MKKLTLILSLSIFVSCATFINTSTPPSINKKSKIAILPLINNSETPMSGFKAKNIIENEFYSKGFYIIPLESFYSDENFSEKEIKEALFQLKEKGADYAIYGYINEWRYKSGADYEPAISLTVNIYDIKSEKIIWSAGGSKTMSSYKSVGITAQKLIKNLLSPIK